MEITCPVCGSREGYLLGDGRRQCKDCRHKFSPRGRKRKVSEATLETIREGFWDMQPAEDIARKCRINRKTVQKVYKELREQMQEFNHARRDAWLGRASADDGADFQPAPLGENEHPLFYLFARGHEVCVLQPEEFAGRERSLRARKVTVLMVYQRNQHSGGLDPLNIYRRIVTETTGDSSCKECLHFILEKMKSYRGVPADRLHLYLEEMVFRFNCRDREDAMRYLFPAGHQTSGNH